MTSPASLSFEVLGIPQPQGSKDAHHHDGKTWVTESNKKVRSWRVSVIDAASRALEDEGLSMMTGPVSMHIRFWFPRPSGHFGTGRNAGRLKPSAPREITSQRYGDLDKLVRAVADALTEAGVWRDDTQVVSLVASKRYYLSGIAAVSVGRPGASIDIVEVT